LSGFLATVCAEARERVARAAATVPLDALIDQASRVPAPASLSEALQRPGVGVIAEVKRASPSRGPLADIPDAPALAAAYVHGGAVAVSVLTEPAHFRGSIDDLRAVTAAVNAPVLRKDFVVDRYQIWEAREAGAAAVLLIVAALEQDDLAELVADADGAGLSALLEVHSEVEVTRAVGAYEAAGVTGRPLLGVNARDLTTLQVDPDRFAVLRPVLPEGAVLVAESGVRDAGDVERLGALGVDAVLVGESVATAGNPRGAVEALVAAGERAAVRS